MAQRLSPSPPRFPTPRQPSLLSCGYSCITCLCTIAEGVGLIYYYYQNLLYVPQVLGTSSLVTGLFLLCFVSMKLFFSLLVCHDLSLYMSKTEKARTNPNILLPSGWFPRLVGWTSLILLLISILLELYLTGLQWWTSYQLGKQFQVRGDCFCEVDKVKDVVDKILDVSCPDSSGMSCPALYNIISLPYHDGGMYVYTARCTMLDGSGVYTPCMEYQTSWWWFKLWRVVLPLVVLLKLPLLLHHCYSWMSSGSSKNYHQPPVGVGQNNLAMVTSAISFSDLLHPQSEEIDPIEFYGNICAPVREKLGNEELDAEEQVQSQEVSVRLAKPATLRSTATMARAISNVCSPAPSSPPPLKVVPCPVAPVPMPNREDCRAVINHNDSPPDIQEHTISTPIQAELMPMTPQFDLSKVAKPAFNRTSSAANKETQVEYKHVNNFNSVISGIEPNLHQPSGELESKRAFRSTSSYCHSSTISCVERAPELEHHQSMLPPPKPPRSSSVSVVEIISSQKQSNAELVIKEKTNKFPEKSRRPKLKNVSSSSTRTPVNVVVNNPSDESSVCGSVNSQTPILSFDQQLKKQKTRLAPPKPTRTTSIALETKVRVSACNSSSFYYANGSALPLQPHSVDFKYQTSDCGSSTCGSVNSCTPIVRSTSKQRTWLTEPAPRKLQLSGTSTLVGTNNSMVFNDILEISKRARKMSSFSDVDWNKLP